MRTYNGPIEPLLFSVSHVAKLIGFSRTTTYELVQAGTIPSILVEGRLRVTRQDLDAWIARASRSTSSANARHS
jgi:excisionase family DNA binding protein